MSLPAHKCPTGKHTAPTALCYRNHGCRCDKCRVAEVDRLRQHCIRRADTLVCPHCEGAGGPYAEGLCRACYVYEWRTGRERPPEAMNPPTHVVCVNCGVEVRRGRWRVRRGRCTRCYHYLWRTGEERPVSVYECSESTDE